jgi:hypothetical protein
VAVKTYTLKYDPTTIAYELSAYVQRIIDGDEEKPSLHRFCALRLNMRVEELSKIAENDAEIGDLLSTLLSHVEAYISDAMLEGTVDRQAAQALLRQPIFSWRDRSIEPIQIQSSVSYDDETRAAILASNDPETIARYARGQR